MKKVWHQSLKCPQCGAGTRVLDSRTEEGERIRRRRQCISTKCGARVSTVEQIEGNVNKPCLRCVQVRQRLLEILKETSPPGGKQ